MSGGIARAAGIVAVFGVVSRILGFVREAVLSRAFGTQGAGGAQADAFANSLFLVNTIAAILLYALVTLVIPAFEQERLERDESSAWRLMWTIATWVCLALIVLGGLMAIWPEAPTALFALEPARARLMEDLVQIMSAGLALQGISALLTAVLQSQRRFVGPAAVGIAFNLGIILGLAIGGGSVRAAAWGVVCGAAAQVVLQLPQLVGVLRAGSGRPAIAHPRLGAIGAMSLPVVGASVLQQINGFTDKLFAGTLDAGRIAALNYANAAGAAPRTVLLVPLLTPLFPAIARLVAERRDGDTVSAFRRAARVLGLVSLPMTAFLMVYPNEVSRILFGGAKCGPECVSDIAGPLRFYALATWAAFVGYLLNRTLSALNRPRDIMSATIVTVLLTIALDLLLLGPMGLSGLALATSLGVIVNMGITARQLSRQMAGFTIRPLLLEQSRIALAAAAGALVALGLDRIVASTGRSIAETLGLLGAKALPALATFLLVARVIAPESLREGRAALRSLTRRRP